jgi:hypothetical protein
MKLLGVLAIGVIPLALTLPPSVYGQTAQTQFQTPNSASVTALPSPRLKPGGQFVFQLRLDKAPEGLGPGAVISYVFENSSLPHTPDPGCPICTWSTGGQTELHDGQAIYTFSLSITYAMNPGTWRLVAVRVTKTFTTELSIPGNIAFEIPPPAPVRIHIKTPARATAGQNISIEVTFDSLPEDATSKSCALYINASLHQIPSGPQQRGIWVGTDSLQVDPTQRVYQLSASFAPDLPSANWQGTIGVYTGPPRSALMTRNSCRTPSVDGDKQFDFTLEANKALVIPTSAVVTVNPSQAELLSGQVDQLRAKARELTAITDRAVLQNSVVDLQKDIDQTEAEFKSKGDMANAQAQAANAFFDDIRYTYGEALTALASQSAQARSAKPYLELVTTPPRATVMSNPVVTSILHNANAYDVVAETKSLIFTLEVFSSPREATISYRLRGGEYHYVEHDTDWKIENLPRAVYLVRVQKAGYEDQERPYDAIDSTIPSIKFDLKRKH